MPYDLESKESLLEILKQVFIHPTVIIAVLFELLLILIK
jgi:hypothetical protein